jgi:hypothetical protein
MLKPRLKPSYSVDLIERLCANGEVARAIRLLKQHGERLQDWAAVLEGGMRQLRCSRREGEMLSIIFNHRPPCPFSVHDLLRALISYGDIPGFLKNAHRLGVYRGFETEIEAGIQWLIKHRQHASAAAYRRKFANFV